MVVCAGGVLLTVATAGAAAPAAVAAGTATASAAGVTTGVTVGATIGASAAGSIIGGTSAAAAVAGSAGAGGAAGAVLGGLAGSVAGSTATGATIGALSGAGTAAAVSSGAAAGTGFATAGAIASGPVGWAILGIELNNSEEYTFDCWKPILHENSTERSNGMLIKDVIKDKRVKEIVMNTENYDANGYSEMIIKNIWDERFYINFFFLPSLSQVVAHATKL